jgi:hypothetical protein
MALRAFLNRSSSKQFNRRDKNTDKTRETWSRITPISIATLMPQLVIDETFALFRLEAVRRKL